MNLGREVEAVVDGVVVVVVVVVVEVDVAGGGGRAAAAGINQLPADQLGPFLKLFAEQFPAQDLRPPTEKIPS